LSRLELTSETEVAIQLLGRLSGRYNQGMGRALLVAACLAQWGCVFDSSGIPAVDLLDGPTDQRPGSDYPRERGRDQPPGEAALSDGPDRDQPTLDLLSHDQLQPDMLQLDTKPIIPAPISATALAQAFNGATVPCVNKSGVPQGSSTKIAEGNWVKLFNATVTLAGAVQETKTWVGSSPAVTVVYDINACDEEYPGYGEWGSTAILVRKATLSNGDLLLQPSVTLADLNFIDTLTNGQFQEEYAKPDDSLLEPHLVNPVNKAKQLILQLGLP